MVKEDSLSLFLLSGTLIHRHSCRGAPAPGSSLQGMGGQAQAGGRAKDIHGVSSMLRRKGGAVSLTREEPMVFPSIHTLL